MLKSLLVSLALVISLSVQAETKYLFYQFNSEIVIVISNVECPYKDMLPDYRLAIVAYAVNGEKLTGCFKEADKDNIEVLWRDGDKSVIPANAFLKPKIPESTL